MEDRKIKDLLLKAGLSPQHSGFTYLVASIKLCCDNPTMRTNMRASSSGAVYQEVAKQNNTTSSIVLQSIRRTLHSCWNSSNDYRNSLFGYRDTEDVPPALEFIARVTDVLLEQEEKDEQR